MATDTGEVSSALERLAARRKYRQYSALTSSNVLSSSSATRCSTSDAADLNAKPKRVQSAQAWSRQSSSTAGRRKDSGPAEFGEYEDSVDPNRAHRTRQSSAGRRREMADPAEDSEDLENPKRVHRRSSHSSGAGLRGADRPNGLTSDTAGMSYYDSQRSMIEQSRALLEQSKAKHHALVAQAHSMQKRLRSHQLSDPLVQESDSPTILAPKPPSAPAADRKPTSTFRTQRLTRYDYCSCCCCYYTVFQKTVHPFCFHNN